MKWSSAKVGKLLFDTSVTPRWLETGDRFWYTYQTNQGRFFYIVDPVKKAKTLLFDNAKMAAMLTAITRTPYDGQHLPFSSVRFIKKDTALEFQFDVPNDADIVTTKKAEATKTTEVSEQTQTQTQEGRGTRGQVGRGQGARGGATTPPRTKTLRFEYDLATAKVRLIEDYKEPERKPAWASISPDKKTIVFSRNHNLYMMDDVNFEKAKKNANDTSIVEVQLTTDGVENYSFGGRGGRGGGDQQQEQQQQQQDVTTTEQGQTGRSNARSAATGVIWAKDSLHFSVSRSDSRKVKDLWVINPLPTPTNPRPSLNTYKYAMPGDVDIAQREVYAFNRDTKARVKIKADGWKDQSLSVLAARVAQQQQVADPTQDRPDPTWFTDAPDKIYLTRQSRDLHRFDIGYANPDTGEVKTIVEERLNTYIETKPPRLINNGTEFLWWSERDGWGHYYLYDINGNLKNQIDAGEFVADAIQGIDEKTRTLYFTAFGREPGEDPYYSHFYKINLDGTGLKLLNPGDGNHAVNVSETPKYFVDNSSRVNSTPRSVLYDNAGTMVMDLETPDLKPLSRSGIEVP